MEMQHRVHREGGRDLGVLVWPFAAPRLVISSAPHGGGLGVRQWVMNAQVPSSYARLDPDHHLATLALALGLDGAGVGMLTAADVGQAELATDDGVAVAATVGLGQPTWAAAPADGTRADGATTTDTLATDTLAARTMNIVGTINIVVSLPERLSDAALVNAVATATEAKAQALLDCEVAGTGTATDAICITCPAPGSDGRHSHQPSAFGGPRSRWGSPLARAVYEAVAAGARAWMGR